MGPRAGLDRCGKSRPPLGFDPRTVQPVASRCTDYTTRYTDLERPRKIYCWEKDENSSVRKVQKSPSGLLTEF